MSSKRRRTASGSAAGGSAAGLYSRDQWDKFNRSMAVYEAKKYGYPKTHYKQYHLRTPQSLVKYGPSRARATAQQKAARDADRVVGRGKFSIARGLRNQFGRQGARYIGSQAMRAASAGMDLGMASLAGQGMYTGMTSGGLSGRGMYQAPLDNDADVLRMGQKFGPPLFQGSASEHDDGGLVIANQEFVMNIYGNPTGLSQNFVSQTLELNPALAKTFPMLSQFAVNFKRYEFEQLVFHFEPQLSQGVFQSETGQVGSILMHAHTDVKQPDFQNITEFESNAGASATIMDGLVSGVECDPDQLRGLPNAGQNFIRTSPKDDVSEYDQGKFQIAVSDTPDGLAGRIVGKLYVSYKVHLHAPRIFSLLSRDVLSDEFIGDQTGNSVTGALPMTVATSEMKKFSTNSIGSTIATTASQIAITLPAYLRGLLCVTLYYQIGAGTTEPTQLAEATGDQYISGSAHEGEVIDVDMTPRISNGELSGTSGGTRTSMNQIGTTSGALNPGVSASAIRHVRVSPALNTDNKIIFNLGSTDETIEGTVGTQLFYVKLEVVNDHEAVGTQSLTDVVTLEDL